MEKYFYNEQNCLWYELQGDYYVTSQQMNGGIYLNALLAFSNKLISQGRYTDAVDEVMIKFAK